ncbi:hypothetical protein BDV25DRAFT_152950 [Aspergillus avenaceus]|uniref:Uncharacterized protein n=1 Tax=Aspergillus avenaceus TaxID=36643 RepID=A0A5N6TYC2_ASPAV|nr:hypothetical protein BDV25DRAFT_152950 [Aspergillus avenaceus]
MHRVDWWVSPSPWGPPTVNGLAAYFPCFKAGNGRVSVPVTPRIPLEQEVSWAKVDEPIPLRYIV